MEFGGMGLLAEQLDTLSGADQARLTEYLDALNPLPGAKLDGHFPGLPD